MRKLVNLHLLDITSLLNHLDETIDDYTQYDVRSKEQEAYIAEIKAEITSRVKMNGRLP